MAQGVGDFLVLVSVCILVELHDGLCASRNGHMGLAVPEIATCKAAFKIDPP